MVTLSVTLNGYEKRSCFKVHVVSQSKYLMLIINAIEFKAIKSVSGLSSIKVIKWQHIIDI